MAYTDKKVQELRNMCLARGLATSGTKPVLISRLEKLEQQLQGENFIKQEENEMQIDMPIIKQQQEIVSSPHVSEAGPSHETLSNVKYEYEHPNDLSQSMNTDEVPVEELYLPQQSLEQHDMSPNVDMSNEYPQSIDPVEQQQQKIDHPPTESPVATSSIVTHDDVSAVEVSSSTNDFEQNKHDQPKPFDSSEKTYTTYQRDDSHYEIDRELLARLISERKNGTQHLMSPKMFSRGIMMNQGQANGVPYNYNYDLLLDIVQKSEIYKDGEIPDWLRYDYDTTFGTTYYGEPECVRDIGIPVEELFSNY